VADTAVLPSPEQIARVERFTQERFVHEGEELATALAAGGARRRAFDTALASSTAARRSPRPTGGGGSPCCSGSNGC
jgi:hypothetical protein